MRLLIIGATGLVGQEALKIALHDSQIEAITVLSRKQIAPHEKIKNIVCDFEKLKFDEAFFDVDAVLCALGTTRRQSRTSEAYRRIEVYYPTMIADAIKKHGACSFSYVSSLGASSSSISSYLRIKAEAEKELQKRQFKSLIIVRPSFITGKRAVDRPLEGATSLIVKSIDRCLPARYRSVSARAIAQCLISSLLSNKTGLSIIESENIGA